jgi:hypothetical protein
VTRWPLVSDSAIARAAGTRMGRYSSFVRWVGELAGAMKTARVWVCRFTDAVTACVQAAGKFSAAPWWMPILFSALAFVLGGDRAGEAGCIAAVEARVEVRRPARIRSLLVTAE